MTETRPAYEKLSIWFQGEEEDVRVHGQMTNYLRKLVLEKALTRAKNVTSCYSNRKLSSLHKVWLNLAFI